MDDLEARRLLELFLESQKALADPSARGASCGRNILSVKTVSVCLKSFRKLIAQYKAGTKKFLECIPQLANTARAVVGLKRQKKFHI